MSAEPSVTQDADSGCAVLDSMHHFVSSPVFVVFQWKFHKTLGFGKGSVASWLGSLHTVKLLCCSSKPLPPYSSPRFQGDPTYRLLCI